MKVWDKCFLAMTVPAYIGVSTTPAADIQRNHVALTSGMSVSPELQFRVTPPSGQAGRPSCSRCPVEVRRWMYVWSGIFIALIGIGSVGGVPAAMVSRSAAVDPMSPGALLSDPLPDFTTPFISYADRRFNPPHEIGPDARVVLLCGEGLPSLPTDLTGGRLLVDLGTARLSKVDGQGCHPTCVAEIEVV